MPASSISLANRSTAATPASVVGGVVASFRARFAFPTSLRLPSMLGPRGQDDAPTRSEAIRRLVELGLKAKAK
jgi:hypothetical protein